MYIVVAIEIKNGFSSAIVGWGPFSTFESANIAADGIATLNDLVKDVDIQVVSLESPNESGDVNVVIPDEQSNS